MHAERYFKRRIDPYLPGSNKYWGIDLPVFNKYIKYAGVLNLPVSNKYCNLPMFNKYTRGINLPVFNKYTGALICLFLTNTLGH